MFFPPGGAPEAFFFSLRILAPFQLKFGALGASWDVFGEFGGGPGASWGRLGGSWGGLRELWVVLGRRRRSGVFFRWGAPIPASTTWSRSPVNKEGESGIDFGAPGSILEPPGSILGAL